MPPTSGARTPTRHRTLKDTYQTQDAIRSELGPDFKIACIGPAGERRIRFASIQHELRHGSGRTGMGAVMGAKNLKAVVVRGTKGVNLADAEKYLALTIELQKEMRDHPGIQDKQKHGHSYEQDWWLMQATKDQVPKPVYSCDLFFKYQSKIKRTGCLSCPIQCMDLYPVEAKGGGALSCSLYIGPLYWVRNTDVELLLECSIMALRAGVDVISSMAIIAWLMELYQHGIITARDTGGIPMEWGSKEAILGMFKKIINREGIGDVLAEGILPAAEKIGRGSIKFANHMKGLPLYDINTPNDVIPDKGSALSMAVSSRGDLMKAHAGILGEKGMAEKVATMKAELVGDERIRIEGVAAARQLVKEIAGSERAAFPDEYEGKPELTVFSENLIIINDCLSTCKMTGSYVAFPFTEDKEAAIFSAGSGVETSVEKLMEFAERIRNLERAYSVREGAAREMDAYPQRFMDRAVPRDGATSVLKTDKFEEMKDKYYALRGWDVASGVPTRQTLEKTGLGYVARDLEKLGKLPGKISVG